MSRQGQRLNFKWSVADIDRVVALAKRGQSASEICDGLKGTSLESGLDEIIYICNSMGVFVQTRKRVRA